MGKILIIDDDEAMAFAIGRLLKRRGYDCETFGNPAEALALLASGRVNPDVVIVDYHMPQLNGNDFVARVREIPALRGLPILLLSGDFSIVPSVDNVTFVEKPFLPEQFVDLVNIAMFGRSPK